MIMIINLVHENFAQIYKVEYEERSEEDAGTPFVILNVVDDSLYVSSFSPLMLVDKERSQRSLGVNT